MPVQPRFIMNRFPQLGAALLGLGVLFWHGGAPASAQESLAAGAPSLETVSQRASAALGLESAAEAGAPSPAAANVALIRQPGPKCAGGPNAFGVSRVVTVDPSEGRHYGAGRAEYGSTRAFLGPKEVVLTFDDGPNPRATREILATLRDYCVQGTFFVTGRAARAHPDLLAEVAEDGHTIAGHSWSHPMPFARQSFTDATGEIERGFREIERALGRPPAAMFRFPGLSDSPELLAYLSERGIMSLSIDVDSGDTFRDASVQKVIDGTLARIERRGGGVILFHDPLRRTSRALPVILDELQRRGYRIVHLVSATDYVAPGAQPAVAPLPQPGHWPRPRYREIKAPTIAAVY